MRNIKAIFLKQLSDTLKNKMVLLQFLMFPVVVIVMENSVDLEGMPEHFGMYEANIILSDLHNPESQKLLSAWWEEFLASESMRDQVALPYVIWKSGHRCEEVGFLGGSMFRNPKFKKVEHS